MIVDFKEFINEAFVNILDKQDNSDQMKRKYADQVWDLLQESYKEIGGLKGSGFGSKEEMIKKIPFWKLVVKNGTVHAAVLYKDKHGRKSVALGSDGSNFAKKHLTSIFNQDFKRAYSEKSKKALGFLMKTVPWVVLKDFIKTPQEAEKILGKKTIPLSSIERSEWPGDAERTVKKYPQLIKYGYFREVGDDNILMFKVMTGIEHLNIV